MSESTTQRVLFPDLISKRVEAQFDQDLASSDAGVLLLRRLDDRLGLCESLASCLRDDRDPERIRHGQIELLRQRVFLIACGWPDANDGNSLADDPIHKLALGRDPSTGERLASQPTVSRFENDFSRSDLLKMGTALAERVIRRQGRRRRRGTRRVTLDFDPTDDRTHGQQEFSFYQGHYGGYCYLPLIGTLQLDDEADQSLFAAVLRPGSVGAVRGFIAVLRRTLPIVRRAFPKADILIRLDAGFLGPEVLEFLDTEKVLYTVGMGPNPKLSRIAEETLERAREASATTGATVPQYGQTRYQARSWSRERRVIFKAEVTFQEGREPRDNVRFVVTNLKVVPKSVYRLYVQRGAMENRIKELKNGLQMDRTSCSRFLANQARVLFVAAAFVLMQELRRAARYTDLGNAQVPRLQLRLLKVPAWVETSVRRVILHLPRNFPGRDEWYRVARALDLAPT
jgi:hypothetical protein